MKVTTLRHLATAINAMGNGHTAVAEKSWTSTDRHPRGVRWRIPGKGRQGTKLIVTNAKGEVVLSCDTSQTTPVEIAINRAVEIFGEELDLDPGELFETDQHVRYVKVRSYDATILSVTMKNATQAKHYQVRLPNGHVTTAEPWRIRRI